MKITDVRMEVYSWPREKPITNGLYTYTHSGIRPVIIEIDEGVTGIGLAGGDLFVGQGVDVRIDAQRHGRLLAPVQGDPVEGFELRQGFHVELQDARFEARGHLRGGLADTGEDDFPRRYAGRERTPHRSAQLL